MDFMYEIGRSWGIPVDSYHEIFSKWIRVNAAYVALIYFSVFIPKRLDFEIILYGLKNIKGLLEITPIKNITTYSLKFRFWLFFKLIKRNVQFKCSI